MANPAPTINQINAFNATQGTTIDFNIIGGTELVRSNRIYIYDLSDNSLICTHLYASTESIHELPPNTDSSIVYESGKSSADFVNGAQYYAQIQTFTDIGGTEGGSGLSVAKMFWCLVDPTLTITTIPSTISTTSYNVSATYNANTSVVSNIIQQYQFNLYSATGSLLQSSGVIVGNGEQQGTSTVYDISYNFSGLSVGSSYYVAVDVTTTQGMSVSAQSSTFTVSIDTPTLGEATVVNNACDGYISVTSNLSSEYGGSGSGEIVSFETDSENVFTKLQVAIEATQSGSGTPSPSNVRPIYGVGGVTVYDSPTEDEEDAETYTQDFDVSLTPTSKDTDPYLFKAVGDIYGDRLEEVLVGATVNWNQLARFTNVTTNGITLTANADGSITLQGTATANATFIFNSQKFPNHVLLYRGCKDGSASTYSIGNSISGAIQTTSDRIYKTTSTGTIYSYVTVTSGTDLTTPVTFTPQFFDLTQMFGSTIADYIYSLEQATAGAGVAWFKKLFPKPYYAYNAGELISVNTSAHNTVGKNLLNVRMATATKAGVEYSYLSNGRVKLNGTKYGSNNANFTDVITSLPAGTFTVKASVVSGTAKTSGGSDFTGINFYLVDSNGTQKGLTYNSGGTARTFTLDEPFKGYLRLIIYNDNIVFKNCEIEIQLEFGSTATEYEPYTKQSYPLDSSLTLRGIPKLDSSNNLYYDGDTYESDGTVTRKYGAITFNGASTEHWNVTLGGTHYRAYITRDAWKQFDGAYSVICDTIICDSFVNGSWNDVFGGKSVVGMTGKNLGFGIDALGITNASDFKTWLASHPITLVFELATPTTEQTDPFEQIQEVSKYGTLEYITTNDVPVGHNTTYYTRDVFGCTLDLVSGLLTVTNTYDYNYDGGDINEPWISDRNQYVSGTKPTTGASVCYPLDEPLTYQLTPQQINTLVGVNNVWSEQGNIELSYHIPITNLLVKRQDIDDVSGNWLTLYSQPITQASDMDFTFIDFLNQYGKTYKYALVPLLTQTQSGVEVEVEGGYTVSDEVQSIFDGVFISDSTGSQKCKANVGYGNVNMNQSVGSITPIGSQYPIIVTNSNNRYHNGSISGMIVPDDYYYNGNLSRIDMVNKRNELEQFLTNKRAKIIKDWNSNIWLVMIMDNIDCSFDNNYGMGMVTFNANWLEVGDPTNQQDLQDTGLINVGGV